MKKIIKKFGNSLIVTIDAEDQKIYGLKEGDIIEMEDIVKVSKDKTTIKSKEEN